MPLPLYLLDVAEATAPQHIRFTDPERSHRAPDLDGDAYRHGGAGGGAPSGAGPSSPIPEPDPDAAIRFIRTAFPGGDWPGHVLIWTLDRRSQRKTSHWVASPGEAETTVRAHAGLWTPRDVYVGMGMSAPGLRTGSGPGDLSPHRRLLKGPRLDEQGGVLPTPSVRYIPGVWADVDYGEEGHSAGSGKTYAPPWSPLLSGSKKFRFSRPS